MNQNPRSSAIGLDFGTTNTVVATASTSGLASVLPFKLQSTRSNQVYSTFRSAMCFWEEDHNDVLDLRFEAGPWAIEHFIDDPTDCRFLQSFKTFAASPLFSDTFIHGRKFTFESLLSAFLEKLRSHTDGELAEFPKRLVVGRPVAFAGTNADELLALARYERALRSLGVEEIIYVYEPVAAAYFYAQRLTQAATVLVADFGGGTSDFSIIRFEPSASGLRSIPLSHSGLPWRATCSITESLSTRSCRSSVTAPLTKASTSCLKCQRTITIVSRSGASSP